MKAFKHQLCHIKTVLNEKSKTEEEDYDESYSNNDFISNDYIALINVHIFLRVTVHSSKKVLINTSPFLSKLLFSVMPFLTKWPFVVKLAVLARREGEEGQKIMFKELLC